MHTRPPVPNFATTTFATVCPATKFTFDASGRGAPHGNTVTYPDPTGFVTVTFTATATASPGTPPTPPTCNSNTRSEARRVGTEPRPRWTPRHGITNGV